MLRHWETPTIGASFILTVATESLALLAATLAFASQTGWLVYAALVPFGLGLVFYTVALSRFDFRQLLVGVGNHWVTGGALAISTVTAGRITLAATHTAVLPAAHATLKTIAHVLWWLTIAWLPALIAAELLRPRLSYNLRRWSTVFPFGMYAACSFIVGTVTSAGAISQFARIWVWIALAVWLLVFAAMLGRGRQLTAHAAGR